MSARLAQLLVFSTSAAVLVLEILAVRLMAPYVGVSIETFTGVIGTVLAGIALGSFVGGKLADRVAPARLIGPAVTLGGLLAWASLPIVSFVGPRSPTGSSGIVLLALLAFFAPAAVLSAVSPMTAKLMIRDLAASGSVVGGLSAAGTLGALVGTFITGFVLVSAVATRPIVLALGLALALGGVLLAMRLGGRRRPSPSTVVLILALFALAATSEDRCDFESAYACGAVLPDPDDPSVRVLMLDRTSHASVDLDDPTELAFRYIRLLGAVVDGFDPGPLRVLHIGGGGFTMPRYVEASRPGSTNLVLEIDPVLVDVARRELGLVTHDDLRVVVGDARITLRDEAAGRYDLVIGDAFSGASVPWHLTTEEFVTDVRRVLRPDGVYAMNLIDGGPNGFGRAMAATLSRVFAHVEVIVPAEGLGSQPRNQILVASDGPLPALAIDPADGHPVESIEEFVDGQRHFTDDYAPADQLATR